MRKSILRQTNCFRKIFSVMMSFVFVIVGFTMFGTTAEAATTVTVDNNYTWAELKTAIETTYKGKDVVFNLNRTTALNANALISVPAGSSVTLTCTNTSHTTRYYTDISRDVNYHGTFFDVQKGATLTLKCCISGGSDNVDGALVYDGSGNRITDSATLSSVTQELRSGEYNYAPVNYKYYGARLITVKGKLVLDNAVLKYNYNPYSPANTNTYTDGVYSYSDRMIANTYSETLSDGTQVKILYYNLPCRYIDDIPVNVGGSAISIVSDESASYAVSNSEIYGCSSDHGPSVICEIDDNAIPSSLSTTKLHKNVARDVGGAVYYTSKSSNPSSLDETISIEDCEFYYNRSNNAGGAISSGYGAKILIDSCKVHDNFSGSYGGGIAANNGVSKDEGNTTHSLHGGTTTIMNSEIYNNTAGSNGGGIGTRPTPDNPTGNILNIHNTKIYNNEAVGEYDVSSLDSANNGFGGGLYINNYCKLTLSESAVFGNVSNGGTCKFDGVESTKPGYGGGIYITPLGPACSFTGTDFYDNIVKDTGHGGAIASYRASGLSLNECTVKNHTSGYGAGVYNFGTLDIANTTISENTATKYGGGISNGGTLVVKSGEIINNNAESGAGIYNGTASKLTMSNGTISENNATKYGGGISNEGSLTLIGGVVENNTAYSKEGYMVNGCGGGIYSLKSFTLPEGVVVRNNTSNNGGGVYIDTDGDATTEDVTTLTLDGAEITGNVATDGGGVVISHSNMVMKSGKVSGNQAGDWGGEESFGSGGGIYLSGNSKDDRGILTISGGEISNNKVVSTYSADGGGIYNHWGTINMSGGIITNNSCTSEDYSTGGGVYLEERAVLNMTGGKISKNSAESGGGVGLVYYLDSFAYIGGNAVITENTADYGGGIYNYGCGSVEEDGTEIVAVHIKDDASVYNNTASVSGGGLYMECGVGKITGGKVFKNTAVYGGGALLYGESVLTLTSNSIYNNTAEYGIGVYVCGADEENYYENICTFKMYDAACVGDTDRDGISDTDDVYLEEGTYISVPSLFTDTITDSAITTGKKVLRAIVTPEPADTGRVIAKFGASTEDEGSQALYWNADTPKMSEQYFTVKGRVLRSGDQGAADNYENLNYQDVFLSEEYTVSFDMNPTASMVDEKTSVKHIVGENEYVFDDLATNTLNKNLYYKYWNEACSFNTGHATGSGFTDFLNWNLAADGSGKTYEADETITLPLLHNQNLVFYAQWSLVIDVDYNGNGATEGEGWTDEKISLNGNGTYELSDKKDAFERVEQADGSMRLFQFMGWSFDNTSRTQQYAFGQDVNFSVLREAAEHVEGRKRQVATAYAVWDEYPVIEAVDRWFTLADAQAGKITLKELMATAIATDGKVGDETDFADAKIDGKELFTIIDYGATDFTKLTKSSKVTITYKAVDKVGNETYKTVNVTIVDKDQQVGDLVDRFTRFISAKFFKDSEGNFVEEADGGLNAESKWVTDAEYEGVLTKALGNSKSADTGEWSFVYETWNFTPTEVMSAKSFVESYGLGNSTQSDRLALFRTEYYDPAS